MSHVTHMIESCHTYEGVMSHLLRAEGGGGKEQMSHVA